MNEETNKQTKIPSELETLKAELEACKKERDEYLDGWKRAKADYLNYKKEEAERFAAWGRMANESLVADLLLVLDSLNVGLSMIPDGSAEKKGMALVRTQMEDVLRRYGLMRIDSPPGKPFDPTRDEAVGEIESAHPPGSVAEEVEKGYLLGGKVLRPVKVKISKGQNFESKKLKEESRKFQKEQKKVE